jgi:drug/metabolite transporter superfamily protein YnfA
MTIVQLLEIVALVIVAIDELQTRGRSLAAWAVAFVCIALLWGRIG